jgi:general secretion pathway protein D
MTTGSIAAPRDPAGFEAPGSGSFTGSVASISSEPTASGEPGVTLNLVDVPVGEAAKRVLGDLLGRNFVVDDRVKGTVTVQTTSPVSRSAMVELFETVLRSHGAAIIQDAGFFRVLPDTDARVALGRSTAARPSGEPGLAVQIVPLLYTSAEEMRGVLEPIAPAGGILRVDAARNLLVLAGTAAELASMREAIGLFDVNWMRGMSFALHPLKSSAPEAIASELDTIFATKNGPLKDIIRFLPNDRLDAVLVISSRPQYLSEAASWIARLDQVANTREPKLVAYEVHNRAASELVPILQASLSHSKAQGQSMPPSVAPALEPVQLKSSPADLIAGPSMAVAAGSASRLASAASAALAPVSGPEPQAVPSADSGADGVTINQGSRTICSCPH